jgi:hypothetical protein
VLHAGTALASELDELVLVDGLGDDLGVAAVVVVMMVTAVVVLGLAVRLVRLLSGLVRLLSRLGRLLSGFLLLLLLVAVKEALLLVELGLVVLELLEKTLTLLDDTLLGVGGKSELNRDLLKSLTGGALLLEAELDLGVDLVLVTTSELRVAHLDVVSLKSLVQTTDKVGAVGVAGSLDKRGELLLVLIISLDSILELLELTIMSLNLSITMVESINEALLNRVESIHNLLIIVLVVTENRQDVLVESKLVKDLVGTRLINLSTLDSINCGLETLVEGVCV